MTNELKNLLEHEVSTIVIRQLAWPLTRQSPHQFLAEAKKKRKKRPHRCFDKFLVMTAACEAAPLLLLRHRLRWPFSLPLLCHIEWRLMKQRMKSSAKNSSHTTIARFSVAGGGRKLRSNNGVVHPLKKLEVADGKECFCVLVKEKMNSVAGDYFFFGFFLEKHDVSKRISWLVLLMFLGACPFGHLPDVSVW